MKGFEVARDAVIYGRPAVFAQFNNADSSTEAIIEMQGKRVLPKSDQGLDIEFAKSGSKFQVEGKDNSKMEYVDTCVEPQSIINYSGVEITRVGLVTAPVA